MVVGSTTHRLRQEILIFSLRVKALMKNNLLPVFLCILMFASSLAGCIGGDDATDGAAITALEDEITLQDDKIAELESEVATITTQHQEAIAELATVQFTLQTTQMTLDFAEANATVHEAEIALLEAEREAAQSEVAMLYELMSNLSNQSNETFAGMASHIAQLNQHVSNLSSMLNESYAQHQENITLVHQLTAERDDLQAALNQANSTLAVYAQNAANDQATAELQTHVHGIIGARAVHPTANGDPKVSIVNNGLSTQFSYTSNISEGHYVFIEFCNSSFDAFLSEIFEVATGEEWTELDAYATIDSFSYRHHYLSDASLVPTACFVLQNYLDPNQFNATLTYPNLNLFESTSYGDVDFYMSVCIANDCPFAPTWEVPYNGHSINQILPHYLMGGDVVPVTVVGELPCTLGFVAGAGGSCQPPACTDVVHGVGSGTYALDCESVLVHEADSKTTVHTMMSASSIFYDQGLDGDSVIYVCDPSADAYFKTGTYGTMDVHILGLGASNEHEVAWSSGSSNKGSITTTSGGTFAWGGSAFFDTLEYNSDIAFLHWTDPQGVC